MCKKEKLICPQCGKEFERMSFNQWYCCKECQREAKRIRDKAERVIRKVGKKLSYSERMKKKDEFLIKAAERHLTYGKYREQLYLEQLRKEREGTVKKDD